MSDVEAHLWNRWQRRRSESAFEQLVSPHVRFLRGFARRLGCADADADDVVQKALVRLSQDGSAKPAKVGLRAWLGRTVLSEARMVFRARKRRRRHESRATSRKTVDGVGAIDRRDEVEVALRALPETERRAVILRFLHDLDYDEVAYILGTTRRAARLRVHRGIARLRKRLGTHGVAALAALPLLGGNAAARTALIHHASHAIGAAGTATVSTIAGSAIVMTATTKVSLGICAALAASIVAWQTTTSGRASRNGERTERATAAAPVVRTDDPGDIARKPAATDRTGGATRPKPGHEPIPPGKGSVIGRVVFHDGEPLRHTKLALWGSSQVVATTDADGNYHIHGDWVGDRNIALVGPRDYTFFVGIARMKADQRVRVDVVIDRGVALVGSVRGENGESVAACEVTLRRPDAHSENPKQGEFGWAKPGPDGTFRFPYVPDGKYSLVTKAKGYEPQVRLFTVEARVDRHDFTLKRARPWVIRFENLPEPARGMSVRWELQRTKPAWMFLADERKLDADGELHAYAPGEGKYRLNISRTPYTPRVNRYVEFGAEAPEPLVITLPSGGAPVTGIVRGPDGAAISGVRVYIKGVTSKATGAGGRYALDGMEAGEHEVWIRDGSARVSLGAMRFPAVPGHLAVKYRSSLKLKLPGKPSWQSSVVTIFSGSRQLAIGRPDDDGAIHFRWLPAGKLKLTALAKGYAFETRWVDLHDNTHMDMGVLDLMKFVDVPVQVSGAGAVRFFHVTTTLRSSGPDGKVSLTIQTGRIKIDENGRGLLQGLPAGTHNITIRREGKQPFEIEMTLREDQVDPIPIALPAK